MSRSSNLTYGHRWIIFALLLIFGLGSYALSVTMTGFGANLATSLDGIFKLVPILAGVAVVATASGLVGAAGTASIYYELRTLKEGVRPEELAAIFD